MAMESPRLQSARRLEVSGREILREVPPVSSFGFSSETTGCVLVD